MMDVIHDRLPVPLESGASGSILDVPGVGGIGGLQLVRGLAPEPETRVELARRRKDGVVGSSGIAGGTFTIFTEADLETPV